MTLHTMVHTVGHMHLHTVVHIVGHMHLQSGVICHRATTRLRCFTTGTLACPFCMHAGNAGGLGHCNLQMQVGLATAICNKVKSAFKTRVKKDLVTTRQVDNVLRPALEVLLGPLGRLRQCKCVLVNVVGHVMQAARVKFSLPCSMLLSALLPCKPHHLMRAALQFVEDSDSCHCRLWLCRL